jgi:hypothetical protein
MISVSDLQNLITLWTGRLDDAAQPLSYRDGISECVYELNQLINKSIDEELSYQDFLDMEADSQLSMMREYGEAV